MVATETVRLVLLILLALAGVWVVICVIKNDMATIVRALIVLIVVGIGFIYVSQTDLEQLSFKAVKEDIFPPKPQYYRFEKRESTSGGITRTTYVFAKPEPALVLSMERGGKNMVIKNVDPLNRVLAFVGLPPVKEGVQELAAITGKAIDANIFRWDKYEMGILTIERGVGHDSATVKSYPCIISITVSNR